MHTLDWTKYLLVDRLRHSSSDKERLDNPTDNRNAFESDFGRVIFSAASRRMHDKTQVIPLTTDDNVHSRLTHSMEAMNIGYSLGLSLCRHKTFVKTYGKDYANKLAWEIAAILKTASFIHDIGNPPFGHFGEDVIQQYFINLFKNSEIAEIRNLKGRQVLDFIHFDGNAQGFRVVTKLQFLNDLYGLNLTYATLASYLKYPNAGAINSTNSKFQNIAYNKHGVFSTEKNYLDQIVIKNPKFKHKKNIRHPLSFMVEASDSICYLVMDIEDGFGKGWYSYNELKAYFSKNKVLKKLLKKNETDQPNAPHRKLVVDFRVDTIAYLVRLAIMNFMKNLKDIETGDYNKELINDDVNGVAKILGNFCKECIFPRREIQSLELTGKSVISGLLDIYIELCFHQEKGFRKRAKNMISSAILRTAIKEYDETLQVEKEDLDAFDIKDLPTGQKLRMIVDYITGMTDQFAVNQYQKLSGQRIN